MAAEPPVPEAEAPEEPVLSVAETAQPELAPEEALSPEEERDAIIAEGDIGVAPLPRRFVTVPKIKLDRRLISDVIAGATFAAVNIPQSLGHGQIASAGGLIAGFSPVSGLYTLMFAMPVAALFTGSVYMNVSTTSALAVAMASSLSVFPAGTPFASTVVPLVLLVGLWQILLGVLRLGFLVRFVSRSVMVGFMTGVAVLIVLGQIGDLTGYDASCEFCSNKVVSAAYTLLHPADIQLPSLVVGLLTMGLIVLLGRTPVKKFAMVIAIVVASAVPILFSLDVQIVSEIAVLPSGLPAPILPDFQFLGVLLPSALAIAIVGLVQGAAISQSYANPDGKFPSVSRDFLGQGIANAAASVMSGIPAGGSASGTALIVSAGQQGRAANIFAGLFVIFGVLLLSPLIGYLAMPALAGLLIVVGIQLIDVNTLRAVISTGAIPATALAVTFGTTLVLPLQYAVFVGVGVSIMLNVFRQSSKVRVVEWRVTDDGGIEEGPAPKRLKPGTVTAVYIYGELTSGGAPVAENALPEIDNAPHCVLIIGLRGREDVSSTFLQILERASKKLAAQNSRLMLAGVSDHVYLQLVRTGAMDVLGRENVFKAQTRLHHSLKAASAAGRAWLDANQAESTAASASTGSPG
jgi:SulP family sulfate permease